MTRIDSKQSKYDKVNSRSHHVIYGMDGLRSLAIIGITLFHMFPGTVAGGYLGVSLFFIISGYLISLNSERLWLQHRFQVVAFYQKRIRRIYPSTLIVILSTIGLYRFIAPDAMAHIKAEVTSVLLGYNNWWQIIQSSDYFTKITSGSPFTHMWYLAVILQFYLLWPLIFWIYKKITIEISESHARLFLACLTAALTVFPFLLYLFHIDITRLYYGTDTRLYAILFGVILGLFPSRLCSQRMISSLLQLCFFPLVAVIIIAYFTMDGQSGITWHGGLLLLTLCFTFLTLIVSDPNLSFGRWLEIFPLTWIGEHSFEIYLWQYPIIFLFSYNRWNHGVITYIIQIILIVVLSAWLHIFTDFIKDKRQLLLFFNIRFISKNIAWVALSLFMVICIVIGAGRIVTFTPTADTTQNELRLQLAKNKQLLEQHESDNISSADSANEATEGSTPTHAENNSILVSFDSVTCVGDSVLLGASAALMEELPGAYIDAAESRQVKDGKEILTELKDNSQLHHTVIIALGTNGTIKESDAKDIMALLGEEKSVFWVNNYGQSLPWEQDNNSLLNELDEKYDNLTVVDWYTLASNHEEWLYSDKVHPTPTGAKEYAKLIKTTMEEKAGLNNE